MTLVKYLIILSFLISVKSWGQIFQAQQQIQGPIGQDRMQQVTLEAMAKFYGLDVILNEASRRVQEKYVPEQVKPAIPYILVIQEVFINQRFVYRSTF